MTDRACRRDGGSRGCSRPLLVACLAAALALPASARQSGPIAAEADPVARELEIARGILDFEAGHHGEAVDRLDRIGPDRPDASYYRGLALMALDRTDEALDELRRLRALPDAPPEVALDEAIALIDRGDTDAAGHLLTDYVGRHPDDPFGRAMLGVTLRRQGREAEASAAFVRAAELAGPEPSNAAALSLISLDQAASGRVLAENVGGPLGDLSARNAPFRSPSVPVRGLGPALPSGWGPPANLNPEADRRWNLAILTGYEFDSNVTLAPSIPLGGLGGFDQESSRWTLASFGEYRIVQRPNAVVGLIGSTYNTFQFRLDDFNIQDYMGGAYGNLALGNFILGGRYEYHETLLDGNQFTQEHRLTPNLTLLEGAFGHTTAYYEYDNIDINGFALVPAQIRTGSVNAVGVTQAVYLFEGAGRLFLGYRFQDYRAVGSDFDATSNMITGRVEVPLPWRVVANAEFRQFWDNYANPNSLDFFGRPRSDTRTEARVGFQKFLNEHLSLRVEYVYTVNDSNVENLFGTSLYSYDRHLLSTLLIYDF